MKLVQMWFSQTIGNVLDNKDIRLLIDSYSYPIGNKIEGRQIARVLINPDNIDILIKYLYMNLKNPVVLGVQNMDGTDYNSYIYPKNIKEFNKFMGTITIHNNGAVQIKPTDITTAGYESFKF